MEYKIRVFKWDRQQLQWKPDFYISCDCEDHMMVFMNDFCSKKIRATALLREDGSQVLKSIKSGGTWILTKPDKKSDCEEYKESDAFVLHDEIQSQDTVPREPRRGAYWVVPPLVRPTARETDPPIPEASP